MKEYSEELKKQIVFEYLKGEKTTSEILSPLNISKSNLYRWKKQYAPDECTNSPGEFTNRNFYLQKLKIQRLESINAILKQVDCTIHSPLSVKLCELEKLYGKYPVHTLCDALEVSRGTFYNHVKRNKRDDTCFSKRREFLKEQILIIDEKNDHLYGASKIRAVLKEQGVPVSVEFVRVLMRELGLQNVRCGGRLIYEKEEKLRTENYLYQNFITDAPDQIWTGDVTYYRFKGNEYYICVILDLFSKKAVAYKIGLRDNTHLTKATFMTAWEKRHPASGLIFHSDQGVNYRSNTYRKCLAEHGVIQSFSRPKTPTDNAPTESFFSSLKKEELYRVRYRSVREFFLAVEKYMNYYNSSRLHQNLHYKTPDEYEAEYYGKFQTNESQFFYIRWHHQKSLLILILYVFDEVNQKPGRGNIESILTGRCIVLRDNL